MHNNIMAAGSRDRPPMLATGRYAQWRSRFLPIRVQTNDDCLTEVALSKVLTTLTTIIIQAGTWQRIIPQLKGKVIHLILTGIEDEIYSTVDACKTAHEIWEAIERLQQGLDDGVAASFQRSRIHKPHAHTQAFKVNRSTSRSLILNFPTIKEPQSQIKNSLFGEDC
ncbi:hypothetical protein Tco_1056855 [Tanacetum coccineum]|uniref:Uncharacterized protein n=1 Tax=Tanacetum coccineum TaxID=301880 RepID=A0ABQ5H3U3_9ASTR